MEERGAGQGVEHVPIMRVIFCLCTRIGRGRGIESFTWVLSSGSFEGGLVVGRSESWDFLNMLGASYPLR